MDLLKLCRVSKHWKYIIEEVYPYRIEEWTFDKLFSKDWSFYNKYLPGYLYKNLDNYEEFYKQVVFYKKNLKKLKKKKNDVLKLGPYYFIVMRCAIFEKHIKKIPSVTGIFFKRRILIIFIIV